MIRLPSRPAAPEPEQVYAVYEEPDAPIMPSRAPSIVYDVPDPSPRLLTDGGERAEMEPVRPRDVTRPAPPPVYDPQPIPAEPPVRPEATRDQLRRWMRRFPEEPNEQAAALDEFVADMVRAYQEAERQAPMVAFFRPAQATRWGLEQMGYRDEALNDYYAALTERRGKQRIRNLMTRARRYSAWTRALGRALQVVLGGRDPDSGDQLPLFRGRR